MLLLRNVEDQFIKSIGKDLQPKSLVSADISLERSLLYICITCDLVASFSKSPSNHGSIISSQKFDKQIKRSNGSH